MWVAHYPIFMMKAKSGALYPLAQDFLMKGPFWEGGLWTYRHVRPLFYMNSVQLTATTPSISESLIGIVRAFPSNWYLKFFSPKSPK